MFKKGYDIGMKKLQIKLMSGLVSGILIGGLLSPTLPAGVVHAEEPDTVEISGISSDINDHINEKIDELKEKHDEINNKIEDVEHRIEEKSDECTIIASAERGGTISDAGEKKYKKGESVTYNITANSGYEIYYVTVDGISMGTINSYTFNDLKKSHSICAHFIRKADSIVTPISKH